MARSTGRGGRHRARDAGGDAKGQDQGSSPTLPPIPPFESDQEAWTEARRLLVLLRSMRGVSACRFDEMFCERAVQDFHQKIRESGRTALSHIVTKARLEPENLVVVCYALCTWHGLIHSPSWRECAALAVGFHPYRFRRLHDWANRASRILWRDSQSCVWPTWELLDEASGAPPISTEEVQRFRQALADLPTKGEPEQKGEP